MEKEGYTRQIFSILIFFAAVCFIAVLKITSTVTIPLTIAILMSFVLQPIVRALTKLHIPWAIATILVSLLFMIAIIFGGTVLLTSLRSILADFPVYETRFLRIYESIADIFNLAFDADKSFFDNLWTGLNEVFNFRGYVQRLALALSGGIYSFGRSLFLVILLMAFLLVETQMTSDKINVAFEGKIKKRVIIITGVVIKEIVHFLFIKFYISLATGFFVYIGLSIIGLDFAIIWAFIAFMLNFIPTFGSIFSSVITTLFAALQFFPSHGHIVAVFALMLAVNFIFGNIVEPKIEGDNLGISPFVIIASLSLWGWVWGFVGMILAVPFMVIIKIVCENIPILYPVAVFLSNKPLIMKAQEVE